MTQIKIDKVKNQLSTQKTLPNTKKLSFQTTKQPKNYR